MHLRDLVRIARPIICEPPSSPPLLPHNTPYCHLQATVLSMAPITDLSLIAHSQIGESSDSHRDGDVDGGGAAVVDVHERPAGGPAHLL